MKVGIVGTLSAFRFTDVRGTKTGHIDLIQHGDATYPTVTLTIRVVDLNLCRVIIDALQKFRDPLAFLHCWQTVDNREMQTTLLQLISIGQRDPGGQAYDGA